MPTSSACPLPTHSGPAGFAALEYVYNPKRHAVISRWACAAEPAKVSSGVEAEMTIYPYILMIPISLALFALVRRRPAIEARPNGIVLYRGLQIAITLAAVAVLCWQVFGLGFQMGGDVARRDARAEARAASSA